MRPCSPPRQLGPRRPELRGYHRRPRSQPLQKLSHEPLILSVLASLLPRPEITARLEALPRLTLFAITSAHRRPDPASRGRSAAGRPCWSSATMRFRSGLAATRCGSCNSWARERRQKARTRYHVWRGASNHARATAAVAARLGMRASSSRMDRRLHARPRMRCWTRCWAQRFATSSPERRGIPRWRGSRKARAEGRRPFVIPLGASTALGAAGYALAIGEIAADGAARRHRARDLLGRNAGRAHCRCRLYGSRPASSASAPTTRRRRFGATIRRLLSELEQLLGASPGTLADSAIEVDDSSLARDTVFRPPASGSHRPLCEVRGAVRGSDLHGEGHGRPDRANPRRHAAGDRVMFWHTGGQVALFA